ncbi:MAG: alpha/beta hydrolase [Verrucomicrobiae bacterium]|nr:alpha/beta hydrolase [Verrucomicrobiae bacterium]
MKRHRIPGFALLLALAGGLSATAAEPTHQDIVFASPGGHDLKLDLYLPAKMDPKPPLVVFIHGGGWRNGSFKNCSVPWLTESGYAVASIGYRLTDVATYPAQVQDCKGAIRWLRAHAGEFGYDATRIGAVGTSAGGYLVAMLGTTGGESDLEGDVGGNTDQSSAVQAVVDYYGPTDFVARSKNQPKKTEVEGSPVRLLLGGPVSEKTELARQASPLNHVDAKDAPLLAIHGEKDTTVFIEHSRWFVDAHQKAGVEANLIVLPESGHGGKEYFEPPIRKKVVAFLDRILRAGK